eukprot:TRINITY_DN1250_c0_g1_i1.p1 TRINITY_DN1250_c0_g1~~TRINITY_DN1250_c0_g1_i1.p1  ORF type:complete len:710 (-),score=254.95 TRINITY_DN1250_c0_g1_i1:74-2203(-)
MTSQTELEALKQLFPSMDKSVIAALVTQCGGNKEEAVKRGKLMVEDERKDEERRTQRKIDELTSSFPTADVETIKRILAENNNDVDAAIESLFAVMHQQQKEQAQAKKNEESKAHQQNLARMFGGIPLVKIQQVLEECEGDVQDAAEQLLRITAEMEEKAKAAKQQQQRKENAQALIEQENEKREKERKLILESLLQHFSENLYITEPDVQQALKDTNWNTTTASQKLLTISNERKVDHLARVYSKTCTREEIRKVLQECGWGPVSAMKKLNIIQAERTSDQDENDAPQSSSSSSSSTTTTTTEPSTPSPAITTTATTTEPPTPSPEEAAEILSQSLQISKTTLKNINEMIEQQRKDDLKIIVDQLDQLRPALGPNSDLSTPAVTPTQNPTPVPVAESTHIPEEPLRKTLPVDADIKASALQLDTSSNIKLTTSVKRCEIGEDIKVTWNNKTPPTTSDWIAMSKVGARGDSYITYQYIGKTDKTEGSLVFKAPNDFLKYEFRYFGEGSYNLKATSEEVSVGPLIELSAKYVKASEQEGKDAVIEVSFQQKAGRLYPDAWIGMYSNSESDNSGYRTFKYIKDSVDNKLSFPAYKTGQWEFRYFPTRYTDVSRCKVQVEGEDVIVLSMGEGVVKAQCDITSVDPATDSVWIGLYFVGQEDQTQWRRYKQIVAGSGVVTFKVMKTPGVYEARVFAHRKYVVVAKSQNTITIT